MPRQSWDDYFLAHAELTATRSTCVRRHVGCVMVKDLRIVGCGFNGSPTKAPHCTDIGCARSGLPSGERLDLCRGVHSEMNAICMAARFGISLKGATCYVTVRPCAHCMRLLIQAGVERVVWRGDYPDEKTVTVCRESGYEARDSEIIRMV